jgi:CheY-like chemotaxis protein
MRRGRDSATVLAVDDLREYLDLYEHRLDDHDVLTVSDGETALEELSEDVDVVLLDRDMPGLSGDDVLARIREAGYDCRVAMVAANDPDGDVLDRGYDAYLTKPVSESELADVVERLRTISEYVDAVEEFHDACERRAARRRNGEAAGALDDRVRDLRERVDELAAEFDERDYRVVFRDLQ